MVSCDVRCLRCAPGEIVAEVANVVQFGYHISGLRKNSDYLVTSCKCNRDRKTSFCSKHQRCCSFWTVCFPHFSYIF